jgi:hypothetical protein
MYTAVADGDEPQIIGQVTHQSGSRSGQISFLAPVSSLDFPGVYRMIDFLSVEAGNWGCLQLLAETDEYSLAFDIFRKAGFSIYGWQRIYHINPEQLAPERASIDTYACSWQPVNDKDTMNVHLFYQSMVPAMVQPYESVLDKKVQGFICKRDAEVLGYADVSIGHSGIYVQPLVHPAVENVQDMLLNLVYKLANSEHIPVYLCIRSYQGWLEAAANDLNVSVSPRQALMVKRLALPLRAANESLLPAFEKRLPEPSATVPAASQTLYTLEPRNNHNVD